MATKPFTRISYQTLAGIGCIAAGIALAIFQLAMFDHTMALANAFTDGQADSWTVFSPAIDRAMLLTIIACILAGTCLSLRRPRRVWLRMIVIITLTLLAWVIFYACQLVIQQHLSHFDGV